MKSAISIFLFCCLVIAAGGCESTAGKKQSTIATLTEKNKQLQTLFDNLKSENSRLEKRAAVLAGLRDGTQTGEIYRLEKVKIGRFTGFYDKDKDGLKEKLIVYVQPIDSFGDVIKAAGSVEVQLWDLDKQSSNALIGKWKLTDRQLKKLWSATIITINYRLVFDISDIVESFDEPLTVKVTFTDYLSGKVFKEQKAIKPR